MPLADESFVASAAAGLVERWYVDGDSGTLRLVDTQSQTSSRLIYSWVQVRALQEHTVYSAPYLWQYTTKQADVEYQRV